MQAATVAEYLIPGSLTTLSPDRDGVAFTPTAGMSGRTGARHAGRHKVPRLRQRGR